MARLNAQQQASVFLHQVSRACSFKVVRTECVITLNSCPAVDDNYLIAKPVVVFVAKTLHGCPCCQWVYPKPLKAHSASCRRSVRHETIFLYGYYCKYIKNWQINLFFVIKLTLFKYNSFSAFPPSHSDGNAMRESGCAADSVIAGNQNV